MNRTLPAPAAQYHNMNGSIRRPVYEAIPYLPPIHMSALPPMSRLQAPCQADATSSSPPFVKQHPTRRNELRPPQQTTFSAESNMARRWLDSPQPRSQKTRSSPTGSSPAAAMAVAAALAGGEHDPDEDFACDALLSLTRAPAPTDSAGFATDSYSQRASPSRHSPSESEGDDFTDSAELSRCMQLAVTDTDILEQEVDEDTPSSPSAPQFAGYHQFSHHQQPKPELYAPLPSTSLHFPEPSSSHRLHYLPPTIHDQQQLYLSQQQQQQQQQHLYSQSHLSTHCHGKPDTPPQLSFENSLAIQLPIGKKSSSGTCKRSKAEKTSKHSRSKSSRSTSSRKKRHSSSARRLPKSATDSMRIWLLAHAQEPYPTQEEKLMFCKSTGLTLTQVSYWFSNARRRILVPGNNLSR
mmetsp:Transcript_6970/g.21221  ORF Transcript_6970/g.21221 Transcript_6970/m.21221 type:complete len:409 (+) Transcript_6970:212-1438(+)